MKRTRVAVFLTLLVVALSGYANLSYWIEDPAALRFLPPFQAGVDVNDNRHLGAEYLNIAKALLRGRGFADPFQVETGPTAWMPPVYPCLLAALLWLLGGESALAVAIVALKNAVLVGTGLFVHRLASATALRLAPAAVVGLYAAWLVAHFAWFFQTTHDVWLVLLCVDLCLWGAWRLLDGPPLRRPALVWGALGGFALLTSPVVGIAWAATSTFAATRRALRPTLCLAALLVLALVAPWTLRNWVVFERPIFVKSNLFFDLHQASYASPDGVYDEPFFVRHPVWTTRHDPRSLYRRAGEAAFSDAYRQRFFDALRRDPGTWLRKAGRRLIAATLVYRPYRPRLEARLRPLISVVHALPFLGLVALLALRGPRLEPFMQAVLVFYAAYLAPYVLGAFYTRYLIPLTPVLMMLAFWGADALAGRIRARRA